MHPEEFFNFRRIFSKMAKEREREKIEKSFKIETFLFTIPHWMQVKSD